jgi:hypothetical protein
LSERAVERDLTKGRALLAAGALAEAADLFERLIVSGHLSAAALANWAVAERRRHRPDRAADLLRAAGILAPEDGRVLVNLGVALDDARRADAATRAFHLARRSAPHHDPITLAAALHALAIGDFATGLAGLEARPEAHAIEQAVAAGAPPRWDGRGLDGRTLLLHAERGAGDAIQFVRFAEMVQGVGSPGRIVVRAAPSLQRLLARASGVSEVIGPDDAPAGPIDCQELMMSLPRRFGLSPSTIPSHVPYIRLDAPPRPDADARRLKVGIAWAGDPSNALDLFRSCGLESLAPLFAIPAIDWVSLQVGPARAEIERLEPRIRPRDLGCGFADYLDTARAIAALDLVISIDTSVAHLAGALARPVWVLLSINPDWRWHAPGRSCPWYPSASLYRQVRPGDWTGPVAAMRRDLEDLAALRTSRC